MSNHFRQISLSKGGQHYVFRYCPGQEADVLDALRTLANDPDSGLEWFDAAVLCYKIARRLERQTSKAGKAKIRTAKKAG